MGVGYQKTTRVDWWRTIELVADASIDLNKLDFYSPLQTRIKKKKYVLQSTLQTFKINYTT